MKGSKRLAASEPNQVDTNETGVSVTVNAIAFVVLDHSFLSMYSAFNFFPHF